MATAPINTENDEKKKRAETDFKDWRKNDVKKIPAKRRRQQSVPFAFSIPLSIQCAAAVSLSSAAYYHVVAC